MTYILAFLLIVVAALLLSISLGVWRLVDETEAEVRVLRDVRKLQINPRTRISQMEMRSGPPTHEHIMREAGREGDGARSGIRRVVVGGEEESELNRSQARAAAKERNDG